MKELEFEKELIEYLSSGTIMSQNIHAKNIAEEGKLYIFKEKRWQYEPSIKTTNQLWDNFKKILEQNNQDTLERPLSVTEFNQVKTIISDLQTPYQAGQFLYGTNGISQVEIDLDDGQHKYLKVFDQKEIGAGNSVYQIVNQIHRDPVIPGKIPRVFDTTLLINGLPIIQIEEKKDTRDVNEALNQMEQYIDENQYNDIFSTLQILVGITPNNVKYMANTTIDKFNKDFAFHWQRKDDNMVVRHWKEFADSVLSIPMAHQMATNYMILDGTENKQSLKVMRPYQVYATQAVLSRLKALDFSMGINKVGYVWHTTGSGKTITSFKTAWLASRMPNIDKVVFVVDRISLTRQTKDNYQAYDPDGVNGEGTVDGTDNTTDLNQKLKNKGTPIVVTSIQKLDHLVKRKSFKAPDKNIVFIVDEAHRSTAGESFAAIQKAFPTSAWVGYTGTPMFDDTTNGLRTEDIFGELLHAYTIREAIADRNVLGFKVDFETTIDEEQMKKEYLPNFYRARYPKWSEEKITEKIENLTQEDMDDSIEPSFYDENAEHIRLVVQDVFKNWRNRSNNGLYNALFTTHVGGGKASTPMAMMYFREFQRVNDENQKKGGLTLKVAITFSANHANNNSMLESNRGLYEAINCYNQEFGTSFSMQDVDGYTEDVRCRLNKSSSDKKYLDLVIVIDQLLTGFDAPELNTLYVDRTLKGASLIQAYSRTNRIENMNKKPWGRIVNYRWPAHNEKLMNDALAIYSNKDSAKLSEEEKRILNRKSGVLAQPFNEVFNEVKQVVDELEKMTSHFQQLPPSEKKKERMYELLKQYNAGIDKLKQYDPQIIDGKQIGFDYDHPEALMDALGMTPEEEVMLTIVLTNELKERIAKKKQIPIQQIDLKMTHVKDIEVDYDYLSELIAQLMNEVHKEQMEEAEETKELIHQFANSLEDRVYAKQVKNAAEMIYKKEYPPKEMVIEYPIRPKDSEKVIQAANDLSIDRRFLDFRLNWGITDLITSAAMREMFSRHRYDEQDLDDTGQIRDLITGAVKHYQGLAKKDEVRSLSKIKYRNELRKAIYQLADEYVQD